MKHPPTPRGGGPASRERAEITRALSHRRLVYRLKVDGRLSDGDEAPGDGGPPTTPGPPGAFGVRGVPGTLSVDLFHGDGLDALASRPRGSLAAVITDPPFGITALAWDKAPDARRMLDELHRATREDGAVIVFASGKFTQAVMAAAGERFRYKLVWRKLGQPTGGLDCRRRPLRIHEDILVLGAKMPRYFPVMETGGKPYRVRASTSNRWGSHWRETGPKVERNNTGERYPIDVIECARPTGRERIHPTQKPVELLERLVRLYTEPGEPVGDPFLGSGSCARACLRAGRSFVGADTDEAFLTAATSAIESEAAALGMLPMEAS